MKKLLSLLAISSIIGTSSFNIVSCSETTDEIAKKSLSISNMIIYIGHNIYDDIRENLASQAGTNITAEDIKNDNEITIEFYDNSLENKTINISEESLADPTTAVEGTIYNLHINITDNDQYFNSVTENDHAMDPIFKKLNLSLENLTLIIGHNIYDDIRENLASQVATNITAEDIKNDNEITIEFYNNSLENKIINVSEEQLADPTIAIEGTVYNLHININANDKYFNPITENNHPMSPVYNKTDLSLDGVTLTTDINLYDEVRTYIASQAKEDITFEDILNDDEIGIALWPIIHGGHADDIAPQDTTGITGDIYELHVLVTDKDQYFNNTQSAPNGNYLVKENITVA